VIRLLTAECLVAEVPLQIQVAGREDTANSLLHLQRVGSMASPLIANSTTSGKRIRKGMKTMDLKAPSRPSINLVISAPS